MTTTSTMPAFPANSHGTLYVPMVRWLCRTHLPRVLEIEALSFDDFWREGDFVRALRQRDTMAEVLEIKGEVAAFIVFRWQKKTATVLNLAVAPHIRRRGLGRLLVERLRARADKHNVKRKLLACVGERNTAGQLFFSALGFRATAILRDYYADGQDAYQFSYRICEGKT